MKKDSIVYFGYNDPRVYKRGVENVILFQSRAFKGLKYYIFLSKQKLKPFQYDGIVCIPLFTNLLWVVVFNLLINRLSNKAKIFIHSHNYILSLFLFRSTCLFTVHDGLYYLRKSIKHKFRLLHYLIEKFVYIRSKKIHFISQFALNNSLYKDKHKHIIIHNTTPLEMFITYMDDFLSPYTNNMDVIKIFTVRGIEKRTNIQLLIDFACRYDMINERPFHIYIAGKGELFDYYQKEINRLGLINITLLGFISDESLCAYYKFSDIVIVPALYGEGFGLPIIEGYLFDKPVIASNVCAIPEVVIDDCFLFNNTTESVKNILEVNLPISNRKDYFFEFYVANYSSCMIEKKFAEIYDGSFINRSIV